MQKLKKSAFNRVFNIGNRYVWFNQITNRIALLDAKQHTVLQEPAFETLADREMVRCMADLGFLAPSDRNESRLLRCYAERFVRPFEFTVELSRMCNFKCTYCYQNGTHDPTAVISYDVLDACCSYVYNVLHSGSVDDFELNIIGGEPLLYCDHLLYLYERIRRMVEATSVPWRTVIDTNGSVLPPRFLESCENTTFSVCLSPQQHHDRTRQFLGGQPSFTKIINNLVDNQIHFCTRSNQLIVRCNLDHDNASELPAFVSFLAGLGIDGLSVMVVNTVNYEVNPGYSNHLSDADFVEHCGIALDEMVRQSLSVSTLPYDLITPCHVFAPYSCKVFHDGRLSGCDISDRPGDTTIFELADGKTVRGSHLLNPLTHKMCVGDYKICNLQVFPLRPYLASYLYAVELGRRRLFSSFEEHGRVMRGNWATLLCNTPSEDPIQSRATPDESFVVF